jgi:hypothetical protein
LKPTNKQRKYCESHRRRQQMKLNRAAHIETALVTIVKWVTPTLPSLTASPSVASLFLPDREKMLKEIISHKKKKGPKEEGAAMRARTYTVVLIFRVATQSTAPRSHPRLPWLLILFDFFFSLLVELLTLSGRKRKKKCPPRRNHIKKQSRKEDGNV